MGRLSVWRGDRVQVAFLVTMRTMLVAVFATVHMLAAGAAEIEGVTMPDTRRVRGAELTLNGIGLRTYSLLQIHVYVAGLYLEHPSRDADEILRSSELKELDLRFVRDVDAQMARKAWREGFDENCKPPCRLSSQDVERFLAAVPEIKRGDHYMLTFTPQGAIVTLNDQPLGDLKDPMFAQVILSTFIGREPPTPRLKHALLGERG
jgi:Chalcone isomerase-like